MNLQETIQDEVDRRLTDEGLYETKDRLEAILGFCQELEDYLGTAFTSASLTRYRREKKIGEREASLHQDKVQ